MRALLALGLFSLSCGAFSSSPPTYDACELAPVPGVLFGYDAYGLNDRGEVVGSALSTTLQPAFIWDRFRGARDIGTLPGHWLGRGNGINNWRMVAGLSAPLPGSSSAVVWVPWSGVQRIADASDFYQPGTATAVNDVGQVVGGDGFTSFVWDVGRGLRQLDPVPGLESSVAEDINNVGTIVVSGWGSAGPGTALISSRTSKQERVPLDGGYALNDRGQVAGVATWPDGTRAAVWDRRNGVRDLGKVHDDEYYSQAVDINNAGTVVGFSYSAQAYRVFVWGAHFGMHDLDTLISAGGVPDGMTFYDVKAINNRGWILANAQLKQVRHTYLLRPKHHRTHRTEPGCL